MTRVILTLYTIGVKNNVAVVLKKVQASLF